MAKRDSYTITDGDIDFMTSDETRARLGRKMRQAVDKHYGKIMAELARFDELSPVDRVRHACVFSIVSPKCKIEINTIVTPILVERILAGATQDQIRHLLLGFGIGLQNDKSERLFKNAEWLRNCTSADMVRDDLIKLAGIMWKTASMMTHLYDQHARIYTLDTHMLRGLRELAGLTPEVGVHAVGDSKRKYKAIENFYLSVHDEVCADVPPFVSQWALWNEFGFGGEHQVHLAIFGIKE